MDGNLFDSATYESQPQQQQPEEQQQHTQLSTIEAALAAAEGVDWEDGYPSTTNPPSTTTNGHLDNNDDEDDEGPSLYHAIDRMRDELGDAETEEEILKKGIAGFIKEKRLGANLYWQQEKERVKAEEKKEKERKKRTKEKKKQKLEKKKEKAKKKREKAKEKEESRWMG